MRILLVTLALLAMTLTPAASANEVGASGGCWDDNGTGGSAFLRVSDNKLEHEGFDLSDPNGIAAALQAFGNDDFDPESGNPCTDGSHYSYAEVHGDVAGQEAQLCFDGQFHTAAGSCPTTPPERVPIPGDHTIQIGTVTSCTIANYAPSSLTITAGESVDWENVDTCAHTATANDNSFDTGTISSGDTSNAIVFDTPGTFTYKCSFHPSMSGEIIVQ